MQARAENFPVALRVAAGAARGAPASASTASPASSTTSATRPPGDRLRAARPGRRRRPAAWPRDARRSPPVACARAASSPSAASRSQPFLDLIEANRVDQTVTELRDVRRPARLLPAVRRADRSDRALHRRRRPTTATSPTPTRSAPRCRSSSTARTSARTPACGRVYLPARRAAAAGVDEAELRGTDQPGAARGRRTAGRARRASCCEPGRALVRRLHGWARLAVAGYVAGGLATADALRAGRLRRARPGGTSKPGAQPRHAPRLRRGC